MPYVPPIEYVVYVGDTGTILRVRFMTLKGKPLDVSDATVKVIKLRGPGDSTNDRQAEFQTDGSDGVIEYVVQDGELSVPGAWSIQGYIETPDGKWHSEIKTFTAKEPL